MNSFYGKATIQLGKHNVFQLHAHVYSNHWKKSSPVSSFTTLIFLLTAVGHVTLVHLLPFQECQRGLFRCDR